ncbi:hypothetical protein M0802_003224 [Mischocyttarus mexicanus]|nr:hypothetical protein M0802_003224 [Mischocyttarus mexicanus]
MQALKLVVIGPLESGKTTISNFLADASEIPNNYHPTYGVRILEAEAQGIIVNNKTVSKDIEIWDCSGDYKFKTCWPAMRKDLHGVMLIYSAKKQDCLKEMQEFYDYFVTQTKLGPDMCVIFCYDPDKTQSELSKSISSAFPKVSHVRCDIEESGNKLQADFRSFLSSLMTKMQDYVDQEEKTILTNNILFAK